ncbi:hypothetical protein KEM56_000953 [Ascosphaera pollenicola]|nr:hypothetical protein KEM56_000953 [Ascosphaera pollenicola]
MAPSSGLPIFLLKTPTVPSDPYEELIRQVRKTGVLPGDEEHPELCDYTYDPTFVPVIDHWYNDENLYHVSGLIASGELARKYAGLIFTSVRAAEGFVRMVQAIVDVSKTDPIATPLAFYTVGPATHRLLNLVRESHFPHAEVVGKEAGTGRNLAHIIQKHYHATETKSAGDDNGTTKKRGLLFLVGEKHRDDIPRILMNPDLPPEERVNVEELVVYETGVMNLFPDDFAEVIRRAKKKSKVIWVVVFSPARCEAMLKVLRKGPYQQEGNTEKDDTQTFIATIGPTTRDFLKTNYGVDVEVCAETPTPEGVKNGIEAYMKEHGINNWI